MNKEELRKEIEKYYNGEICFAEMASTLVKNGYTKENGYFGYSGITKAIEEILEKNKKRG